MRAAQASTKNSSLSYVSRLYIIEKNDTKQLIAILLVLLTLLSYALLTFASGFFPPKITLSGYASMSDAPREPGQDSNERFLVPPKFDRLVLMLVDALRSDLVFSESSKMEYTKGLIDRGQALGFRAFAHPPTVTLPRIKALISGGIPSFIDFIGNFRGNSYDEDNLIKQLLDAQKKIVFYGDDTWLKLFPRHFNRSEGVTSFFVADTIEVDNNVTRNLDKELQKDDWDVMILHYLGLDHVGHLGGPNSPLMGPKQKEMDSLVEKIHKTILQQDSKNYLEYNPTQTKQRSTLFILCGDHGMNEIGNHGGSTEGETSPALIFISPKLENVENAHLKEGEKKRIQQIDLVPSLALLLGLPIPKNNLGQIIPYLFSRSNTREQLRALQLNSYQQLQVIKSHSTFWSNDKPANSKIAYLVSTLAEAESAHERWLSSFLEGVNNEDRAQMAHKLYMEYLRESSAEFGLMLTNYNMYQLYVGIFLTAVIALATLLFTVNSVKVKETEGIIAVFHPVWYSLGLWAGIAVGIECIQVFYFAFEMVVTPSEVAVTNQPSYITQVLNSAVLSIAILLFIACWEPFFKFIFKPLILKRQSRGLVEVGSIGQEKKRFMELENSFLFIATVLHLVSLGGSSMIEEEHQIAYFFTMTIFCAHGLRAIVNKNFNHVIKLVFIGTGLRVARSWNQTGNKWLELPDIAKYLLNPQNVSLLHYAIGIALVWPLFMTTTSKLLPAKSKVITLILSMAALVLIAIKIIVTMPSLEFLMVHVPSGFDKINSAQLAYAIIAVMIVMALIISRDSRDYGRQLVTSGQVVLIALQCLFLLVHKPHNLLLFAFFSVIARFSIDVLSSPDMADNSLWSTVLTFIWLGKSSWFSLANSNSLATIDISGAYTGLASYNETVVAVLTFVIGYSGPIYFFVACVVSLIQRQRNICIRDKVPERSFAKKVVWDLLRVPTIELLLRTLSLLIFNIIITAMRYHLFIWTVFSPKYFYEIFHSLFVAFNVLVVVGLILIVKSRFELKKVKKH